MPLEEHTETEAGLRDRVDAVIERNRELFDALDN